VYPETQAQRFYDFPDTCPFRRHRPLARFNHFRSYDHAFPTPLYDDPLAGIRISPWAACGMGYQPLAAPVMHARRSLVGLRSPSLKVKAQAARPGAPWPSPKTVRMPSAQCLA